MISEITTDCLGAPPVFKNWIADHFAPHLATAVTKTKAEDLTALERCAILHAAGTPFTLSNHFITFIPSSLHHDGVRWVAVVKL